MADAIAKTPRPREEEPPAPEDVGQPPAEQQQPAGHQDVAVDDPGETGLGEPEVVLDVRERDVHHGDVQDQHELDEPEDAERLPAARVGRGGCQIAHGKALRPVTPGPGP
ncbi:hypothetical protein ACVW00_002042 [Marmoricola sp. URHA0025 HA25]